MERLVEDRRILEQWGAAVVLIGQGEPERSRHFASKHEIAVPMLCDPARLAYAAFGLHEGGKPESVYGAPELLGPDAAAGLAMADRFRAEGRWLVDSPWQLGR